MQQRRKLSETQIKAIRFIADGKVTVRWGMTVDPGPVALNTLWSLEERGIVVEPKNEVGKVRLTPFGRQLREWLGPELVARPIAGLWLCISEGKRLPLGTVFEFAPGRNPGNGYIPYPHGEEVTGESAVAELFRTAGVHRYPDLRGSVESYAL
jgi:hypothetical protein